MRVLLTGGHGFVGSHLVRRLLAEGDEVRCLVRRRGVPPALAGLPVETVVGGRDRADEPPLGARRAWTRSITWRPGSRVPDAGRHVPYERAAGRDTSSRPRPAAAVSRASSTARRLAVAAPRTGSRPQTEAGPCRPVTWYGASRRPSPSGSSSRTRDAGCRSRSCGRRSSTARAIGACSRCSKPSPAGWKPLLGPQPKWYSWVFGPDLADALVTLGRHPATRGGTYYACHPEVVTLESFLETVALAARSPGPEAARARQCAAPRRTASPISPPR